MFPKRLLLISAGLVCLSQLPRMAAAQTFIISWGSYGSGDGQFQNPLEVAVGGSGNVYVADQGNGRVVVFTSAGSYLRQWSLPIPFDPAIGHTGPVSIAVDANEDVYVTGQDMDQWAGGGGTVFKFSSTGNLLTTWVSAGPGQFTSAGCIAVDGLGNVYVGGDQVLKVFTPSGNYMRSLNISGGGFAIDAAGDIYETDALNANIRKFSNDGILLTQWGGPGAGDGEFSHWPQSGPTRIAIGPEGNVYVTDFTLCRVQAFTGEGGYITKWGSVGSSDGQFLGPVGIAADGNGDVYVVDKNSSRIEKFSFAPTPVQSVTWGSMKARYRSAPGAQPTAQDR